MTIYGKAASWCIGSLFLLCACGTLEIDRIRATPEAQSGQWFVIDSVPFFAQQDYQCGPAALAMLLNWSGHSITPEEITPLVYVPGRKGSFQIEMLAAARSYNRIPYELARGWAALIAEIEAGNPVLVLQNLGLDWFPKWHFAVVTGIDMANNEIILHSGIHKNHVTGLQTFERTWQRANKWAMVVMTANRIPASADALSYVKTVSYFEQPGRLEIALQAYQSAAKKWPTQTVVLMGLGNVYYQLGQLEEARQQYERALEINGDYAPARNNLAQILLETGHLEDALYHARIAVRIGGVHAGQFRETLEQIERRQNKLLNQ
ncbi:MAG: PA2778 family cysteine peptidase [Gammaproteobacteria bacterium]|nr:PA2778 family cysteine peptidase [Gammaproteobacteria bacterium]